MFKWKVNQFDEVVRAKARLVAKGFSQKEGIDYFQTFAPTPASATIRLVVCTALNNDLDLFHFDAEQALVQSDIDADIYMRMPAGSGDLSGKIVKLNKSLYGLKQSARSWYDHLVSTLKGIGFEQYDCEPCLLRLMNGTTGKYG